MKETTRNTMFSSKSDEWATPEDFYANLNETFGPFTLDPAADDDNHKCDKYFTMEDDGLKQSWAGETVFVNPPYTRGQAGKWLKKAYEESQNSKTTVVALVAARSDTKAWHDYAMKATYIFFVKGRLHFSNAKAPAPFPSCVVVFCSESTRYAFHNYPKVYAMDKTGRVIDSKGERIECV